MEFELLTTTAAERDFYGENLILLEGVIEEFLSCLGMMRRRQVSRGRRDPIASVRCGWRYSCAPSPWTAGPVLSTS